MRAPATEGAAGTVPGNSTESPASGPATPAAPSSLSLEQQIQADTERRTRRRNRRRGAQWALQNAGMSRSQARRLAFGDTRREATSHLTRGQQLNERIRVNAARKRWRRRQAVASSIAVMEGSF